MDKTLLNTYKNKIKCPEELIEILGKRPRLKKVVMCHGVFDIVHPGHIRHLIFAKQKADILIVSITADIHINKGVHRPHVPQELRAVNLAAFEMVDYVLIDKKQTPLDNLKLLEPDYYAKGFEYTDGEINPKTQSEIDVLSSFGGSIIFTPGDVVYSSTNLINISPPSLKLEKLLILMDRYNLGFKELRKTLESLSSYSVHVVGDTIIDSFTQCGMIGGQTKTPTLSVLFERKQNFVGGAGIVAKHMKAAGAKVHFTTVLGEDELKQFALEDLKGQGIIVNAVIDDLRPTTNKNAIIVDGYRLLKIDTLDNVSVSDEILEEICQKVSSTVTNSVVYSDFRHGIFNRRTIPRLIGAINHNVFKVADSQVASRWGNILEFNGFDMITPNEREARFALGDQDSGIRFLASKIYDDAATKLLILKLGKRGILVCNNIDHENTDSFFTIDSFADNIIDPVGSGDALLAYATLAMLHSKSELQAAILGSLAAACECEVDGNIPIFPEQVLNKLESIERLTKFN